MRNHRTARRRSFALETPIGLLRPSSTVSIRFRDYVINGRSGLDWIVEQYGVWTDKASAIVNDANLWGEEHGDPHYILNLLKSIVTVSIQTLDLAESLPGLGLKE
jgi:predicted helicase